jgi:transposase-like protein
MVATAIKCPFCGSGDVRHYGPSNGKKRYACNSPSCPHQTFYAEYRYNGYRPDVKKKIIKRAADGAGIRATAQGLGVSKDTVMKELKKRGHDRIGEQGIS